ncbi:MAG: hypothetical protein Q7S98_02560 [Deltaproteobacteria bacterium]|nr:hypothetical protein [Deltaproteobacteria bacterium]
MRRRLTALTLIFSFLSQLLLPATSDAVYVAKKLTKEAAFSKSLSRGWIYSEADYDKDTGIRGRIVGAIEASPTAVWELYFRANDWNQYKMPSLKDSVALSPAFIKEFQDAKPKSAKEFYKLLGNRHFDQDEERKPGKVWESYSLQFYDLPWPVDNKWFVIKHTHDETRTKEGLFSSKFTLIGGNIKAYDGEILLKPFQEDSNRTEMDYQAIANSGYQIPKFLLVWGVHQMMPRVIKAIRKYLVKTGKGKQSAEEDASHY